MAKGKSTTEAAAKEAPKTIEERVAALELAFANHQHERSGKVEVHQPKEEPEETEKGEGDGN